MGKSRSPRNGIAKLLTDADPDTPLECIVDEKDEFECPKCGWETELRRNQCLVCDYDQPVELVPAAAGGSQ